MCDDCCDLLEIAQSVADHPEEWAATFVAIDDEITVQHLQRLGRAFANGLL